MVEFLVLVEGGGSTRNEQAMLRKGFKTLFDQLRRERSPKVWCAGGRAQAFEDFKRTLKSIERLFRRLGRRS